MPLVNALTQAADINPVHMYAAGTGGFASSGSVIRKLIGTTSRRDPRNHAATVAMMRPTADSRLTCVMASGSQAAGDIANLSPASLVDAFGDCLFRSAPEASHHQGRHDGNEGHNDPIRKGRDSDNDRRKEDRNRPGNEQQCLGSLGVHETSVATRNRARCSELHGRHTTRSRVRRPAGPCRPPASLVPHMRFIRSTSARGNPFSLASGNAPLSC